MRFRPLFPSAVLASLLVGFAGCSMPAFTHEELAEKTFAAKPKPTIYVETFNGQIDVKADGPALLLAKVWKRGSGGSEEAAKDDCENVEVAFEEEPGNVFRIVARRKDGSSWSGRSGARVELLVPVDATLNLKTSNGAVAVAGPTRGLTVKSSNGSLSAKGGKGLFDLQTSNGRVEVEAEEADLKLKSSNGKLRFVGSLAAGEHTLQTSNGTIDVQLPSDASFKLDAVTSNGRVSCAFDLKSKEKERKSRLAGVVGDSPLATLTLKTSNGSVEVEKRD